MINIIAEDKNMANKNEEETMKKTQHLGNLINPNIKRTMDYSDSYEDGKLF